MNPSAPFIVVSGVSRVYRQGDREVSVLRNLSLEVQAGEFLALMGPSGSGKSTLLNLIGGIDRPSRGELKVTDVALSDLSDSQLADWRARTIGFVFQMYNLIGGLSAARNVELPLLLTHLSAAERAKRVRLALELVGLSDRSRHKPAQLSGGQQQRVGIARAIVADPDILLCDEPTGDLDRAAADDVLSLLSFLSESRGKTIVMVTHDPIAAARANRRLQLEKGALVEAGVQS